MRRSEPTHTQVCQHFISEDWDEQARHLKSQITANNLRKNVKVGRKATSNQCPCVKGIAQRWRCYSERTNSWEVEIRTLKCAPNPFNDSLNRQTALQYNGTLARGFAGVVCIYLVVTIVTGPSWRACYVWRPLRGHHRCCLAPVSSPFDLPRACRSGCCELLAGLAWAAPSRWWGLTCVVRHLS